MRSEKAPVLSGEKKLEDDMKKREEFKLEEAREIWKKLIAQGWKRTKLFE